MNHWTDSMILKRRLSPNWSIRVTTYNLNACEARLSFPLHKIAYFANLGIRSWWFRDTLLTPSHHNMRARAIRELMVLNSVFQLAIFGWLCNAAPMPGPQQSSNKVSIGVIGRQINHAVGLLFLSYCPGHSTEIKYFNRCHTYWSASFFTSWFSNISSANSKLWCWCWT